MRDTEERRDFWLSTLILFLVVLVMGLGMALFKVAGAEARDLTGKYAESPLKSWFNGLTSRKGPCCDLSDGYRVDDADWESHDGHFRVKIDGEWVDVEEEAVLNQPNLAGHTMVWPMYKDGRPKARCFIVGPLS